MKSAYQIMKAMDLAKSREKPTTRHIPSKPNGTKLAAKKHRRRITNASKRRNRKQ